MTQKRGRCRVGLPNSFANDLASSALSRVSLQAQRAAFKKPGHKHLLKGSPPTRSGLRKKNFLGKMLRNIQMKMARSSNPQVLAILCQTNGSVPVVELSNTHGMSTASFFQWPAKDGGTDALMIAQTRAPEVWAMSENDPGDRFPGDWNRPLKKSFAKLCI